MKLKSYPEDFRVEEVTDVTSSTGKFAFYRLEKEGFGTLEAVQAIVEAWDILESNVSFGGLKDKHAQTVQYLSIERGPQRDLQQKSFSVKYLGPLNRPYTSADIRCNRFSIRLRGIPESHCRLIDKAIEHCQKHGVPNYFDDQRFGSLGETKQFCAEPWCRGDYERALWLALADYNSHDRPREREQKKLLQEHWGEWDWLSQQLDRSHRRDAAEVLRRNPRDFRVALTMIRHDLRSLYLAAFQSHLWNELLGHTVRQFSGEKTPVVLQGAAGELVFPGEASEECWSQLRELVIPLPSSRVTQWPTALEELLQDILAPYSLSPKQIRIKYPRDTFFSKGERSALMPINNLQTQWDAEPLEEKQSNLHLAFELPRGSYATLFIRWLKALAQA